MDPVVYKRSLPAGSLVVLIAEIGLVAACVAFIFFTKLEHGWTPVVLVALVGVLFALHVLYTIPLIRPRTGIKPSPPGSADSR